MPGRSSRYAIERYEDRFTTAEVLKRIRYIERYCKDEMNYYQDELEGLSELALVFEDFSTHKTLTGAHVVRMDYFQWFVKELAEEYGFNQWRQPWPANCIDWSRAADALRECFTPITYRGNDFLIQREALDITQQAA